MVDNNNQETFERIGNNLDAGNVLGTDWSTLHMLCTEVITQGLVKEGEGLQAGDTPLLRYLLRFSRVLNAKQCDISIFFAC